MEYVKDIHPYAEQNQLFRNSTHYFHTKYAAGRGTNTKAKFVALWVLLNNATQKGVKGLQAMGASKLVIDWANGKNKVVVIR